jgi:exoribonuclease-2
MAPSRKAETVQISTRQRGAPLDLIVAEAMILANSTWGSWMAELGVPGIYRSQASLAPGVKVRMGTKALPHAGIGVKSYAWSSSPLRRYVDLVNQWQIIACVQHGKTAALAAPFKPKDASLFSIISSFDEAYSAYNGYQGGMERFWTCVTCSRTASRAGGQCLQGQHGARRHPAPGAAGHGRAKPAARRAGAGPLGEMDLITLDISGTVLERLDTPASDAATGRDGGQAG